MLLARRRRQDALALVEVDRLGRHPGPAGQFPDLETTTHLEVSLNLFPLGEGQGTFFGGSGGVAIERRREIQIGDEAVQARHSPARLDTPGVLPFDRRGG